MTELGIEEKVVCRYKNGRIEKGQGLGLDAKYSIYRLIPADSDIAIEIPLSALKAIFCVQSLQGKKDRKKVRAFEEGAEGTPIRVCFRDNEVLYGRKELDEEPLGFWMRPDDSEDNNTTVFIPEGSARWIESIDPEAGDAAYLVASYEDNAPISTGTELNLSEPPSEDADEINYPGASLSADDALALSPVQNNMAASNHGGDPIGHENAAVPFEDPSSADSDRLPQLDFGASDPNKSDFSDLPPLPGMGAQSPGAPGLPSLPDLGHASTDIPGPSNTSDFPPLSPNAELSPMAMPPLAGTNAPQGAPAAYGQMPNTNNPYPPAGQPPYPSSAQPVGNFAPPPTADPYAYGAPPPPAAGTGVYPTPVADPYASPVPAARTGVFPTAASDSYGQPPRPTGMYPSVGPEPYPPASVPMGTGTFPSNNRDPYGQPPAPNSPSVYPPGVPVDPYSQPAGTGAYRAMGQDPYSQPLPPATTGAYPAMGQDPYSQPLPPATTGAYPATGQDPYLQPPPPAATGAYPAMGQDPYSQPPPPAATGAYPATGQDPYSQPPPPAPTGAYPATGQDPYSQPPPPAATGAYPAMAPYAQSSDVPNMATPEAHSSIPPLADLAPPPDSVFSSDAPLPAFDLGELTPGAPLGTGDLPSPNFSSEANTPGPEILDVEEEEEEGNDQTFISTSTKDWGAMMGGIVPGAQVTVPRAISISDVMTLESKAQHETPKSTESGAALDELPIEPALVAEPVQDILDLEMEEPVLVSPVAKDISIDAGTYDVENSSMKLPDYGFQSPGSDSIEQQVEPELLPMSALTAIEEVQEVEERMQSLPTGEYSLEGNNVVAMPWLDDEQKGDAAKATGGAEADFDDLFEDPVEMTDSKPASENKLDGALADFLKDV